MTYKASVEEIAAIGDAELCQKMLALLKRFKAALADIAEAYGLTTMQLAALQAIREGHNSMGKVAQSMRCDASNVTGIIDRLVALQLVTRQEDSHDRRIKNLELTAQGKEVLRHVLAELPAGLGCDRLEAEDRAGLHRVLVKLTET